MSETSTKLFNKLNSNNKIIVQIFHEDGSYSVEHMKSINDVCKKFNLPYSTLINLYYICTNKGGGRNKCMKKKYIHSKYLELLKHIRIFDSFNNELMHDNEHILKLLSNNK